MALHIHCLFWIDINNWFLILGLKDEDTLGKLEIVSGDKLFVKDLGPQIGWTTVFFCEYTGPLILYLWIYQRPWLFYGDNAASQPYSLATK